MKRHGPAHALLALALVAYPLVATPFFTVQVGAQSLILGVVALSLMFLGGYGGMVSLAQMTVAGFAGYMVAMLGVNSTQIGLGWPWWVVLPCAVALATVLAAGIGAISVRTEGIYTIMITLAIAVAVFYLMQQNYTLFNGFNGFAGVVPPRVLGVGWREPLPFYYLSLAVAALCYALVLHLSRSPFGLALQATRDNPRRMRAIGFHVTAHRVAAYAVAGFVAALGGVLLVWYHGRISPGSIGMGPAIDILIIAILGGLGHPAGPFVGAVVFVLLQTFAIDLIDRERFNTLIGAVFVLVVLVSPDGVLGLLDRARGRQRAEAEAARPIPAPRTSGGGENLMRRTSRLAVVAAALAGSLALAAHGAAQEIKIGGLATLEGPFAVPGQDSFRGIELALSEHNYTAGGKKLTLVKGSSDANPDVAVNSARKLVEQDRVAILIGPLSGSEGIAVKNYAKTRPGTTFVNGTSAAQDTTLRDPAPNFYRFTTDGAQWQAGLGEYAFKDKGYKRVALVAEDYSFPYSQVMGFMLGYCAAGGKVVQKYWVPLGTKDYSSIVAQIPDDIDALYVVLGGADAINFLTQYQQAGGGKPMIGGSITVDQTVLGAKGRQRDYLIGTPSAGPIADAWDNAKWKAFVAAYKKKFPDGLPSPSLFAHGYYVSTKAVLMALDQVKGDLSDGHKKFRQALQSLKYESPTGMISLDRNRQAVADIFLTEVAAAPGGGLYNKVVRIIPQVNQSLGTDPQKFLTLGPASRTNPECK